MLKVQHEMYKRRLSQAEVARRAGINQTSMSRIVNGKEPAFPNRGKRIADALGWKGDPAELFEEVDVDDAISR